MSRITVTNYMRHGSVPVKHHFAVLSYFLCISSSMNFMVGLINTLDLLLDSVSHVAMRRNSSSRNP